MNALPAPPAPPAKSKPPTILLVDDTESNLILFRAILRDEYEILSAESGKAALQIASETIPDLILLDVMMPDMDGFATAEAFKRDPRLCDIPIIFLTARSDKETHIRGLELGAVDFLTKPVGKAILRKRVANVIEREQLRAECVRYEESLRQMMLELTEDRNLLASVFNASNDALLVISSDFDILRFNQRAPQVLGVQPDVLTGSSLLRFEFSDRSDRRLPPEEVLDSAQRNSSIPFECTLGISGGRVLAVSVKAQAMVNSGDRDCRLLTLRDISYRMALEKEKLRVDDLLSETVTELETQKAALDQHALVSITDARGIITYVNEKFCAIAGYSAGELIGRTHRVVKSGEHGPEFYEEMWRTLTSGKIWHGEVTNRAKDGHLYWVAATIVPWLDKDDIPYQYVAIRTDISDRRLAELELASARAREIEVGAFIQQQLLFGKPPKSVRGFSVACYTEASQGIDGDFYTFTQLGDDCFEILAGDVMGKGLTAALIGAGLKNTYRKVLAEELANHTGSYPPVAKIVNAVHAAITPELIRLESFVTLVLLRFDRQAKTLTWTNAGHLPSLLAKSDGECVKELLGSNLPLGVLVTEDYVEQVIPLDDGDTCLLFSDGLSDSSSPDGVEFGIDRVKVILNMGCRIHASASTILNSLRTDINDHTRQGPAGDDRTAVVVRVRPVREALRGSITQRRASEYLDIPRQLDQLGLLRQRIAALAVDQPEELVQALVLAVFEAATNVIRHTPEKLSHESFTAVLSRSDEAIIVELVYAGDPFDPSGRDLPDFSGNSSGGFGLFIMKNMLDELEYDAPMPGMARIRCTKNLFSPAHAVA